MFDWPVTVNNIPFAKVEWQGVNAPGCCFCPAYRCFNDEFSDDAIYGAPFTYTAQPRTNFLFVRKPKPALAFPYFSASGRHGFAHPSAAALTIVDRERLTHL